MKQHEAVIEAMRSSGGYATLGHLYQTALKVEGSAWGTKTPFATIRRIVFDRPEFFKIKPGLWGLEKSRKSIEKLFALGANAPLEKKQAIDHSYYQGLIVEIGNLQGFDTFVPYQDKNRKFLDKTLSQVSSVEKYPAFTYDHLLARARMIDVTWFNTRKMPSEFFEVEHTTDVYSALLRFMDLQDFAVKFHIVADAARQNEYKGKLGSHTFTPIAQRVSFLDYETLSDYHTKLMAAIQVKNVLAL